MGMDQRGKCRIRGGNTQIPGNRRAAVDRLNLTVESGEFMVLLGASGSGKTTALRMLAGLETVDSGAVLIGGEDVSDLEPGERDIAMVFQNYALYPQMNVAENLAFRLENAHRPYAAMARRVQAATKLGMSDTGAGGRATFPAASSSAWRWAGRSCASQRST